MNSVEEHPSNVAMNTKDKVDGFVMGVNVPDKGIRWLSINSKYYLDPDTEEERTITSFFDITDIKNKEFQIAQMSHLSAIGEMAAGIAHEINNPLTIAKLIVNKMNNPNQAKDLIED